MIDPTLILDGFIDNDHAYDVRAEAYTRPHLVFRVDNYFIDYWLPLLGTTNAWLVVALQQACWEGNKPGNSTQTSQTELGEQCGLGRQRVNELLTDDLIGHFISGKQSMYQAGQRQPNSYRVRLTSPFIPAHVAGLQQEIAVRLDDGETLTGVMQSLINEATTAREALLERITLPDTPASFPQHTMTDLVQHFTGQKPDKSLRQQIERLAGLLLQPQQRQIEQHYLRREWLPLLGHAGTWLVMVIRRACYADGEEVRDEFAVEKAALAKRLGVSRNTLGNLVKNEHLPQFFHSQEDGQPWQPDRYRLEGRVRLDSNPLTPADQKSLTKGGAEPTKGGTVDGQKATRLEADAQKDDTVTPKKTTRLEADAQKDDTVTPKKTTRLETDAQKDDSDSALFKDSALKDSTESESVVVVNAPAYETTPTTTTTTLPQLPEPAEFDLVQYLETLYRDEVGKLTKIIRQKIAAGAAEIPDRTIWDRAFVEMAEVAPNPGWRYALTVARRMQRDAVHLPLPGSTESNVAPPPRVQPHAPAAPAPETEALWAATLAMLRSQMTRATFDAWLKETQLLTTENGVWTVAVGSAAAKDWLENRLLNTVERAAGNVAGRKVVARFVTAERGE